MATVRQLYAGRGFSEAIATVESSGADLWVISAGLGLVHGEEKVPAYDLTLSAGSASSIRRRVSDGPFDGAMWWSGIGRRSRPKRSLYNLVMGRPSDQFIISVPGSYLELIQQDLLELAKADLERVRLVGPLRTDGLADCLKAIVMPYDDRFNGPESPLPGTRADFPQRVARHFFEKVYCGAENASPSEHADRVRDWLAMLSCPAQVQRRQLGDDQIVEAILANWEQADGQSAKMLRVLRDDRRIACEQGRFTNLFKRARRLRFAQESADTSLRLRAVRSVQGNGIDVFSFFIPGDLITQIADITRLHRDGQDRLIGFQRDEIKRHVNGIIEYLDGGDVLFPNAIILAFSPEVSFTQTRGGKPDGTLHSGEAGTLTIPLRPEGSRIAWIVDGQQRALALSKSRCGNINVPIIAFVAPDLETRREQFILVNKAKPLPLRLINELLPEVEAYLPRDLVERKIPSTLCELLSQDPASPFHGIIKRSSTKGASDAIVIDSAIVELIRTSLKNPNGALAPFRSLGQGYLNTEGMYVTLLRYWTAVKTVFPDAWGLPPTSSRLMHSAGLRAMGVLMDRIVTRAMGKRDSDRHINESLLAIAPHCRWTEGVWEELGLEWNEIQHTPRHLRQLSDLLCHLDYSASMAKGSA